MADLPAVDDLRALGRELRELAEQGLVCINIRALMHDPTDIRIAITPAGRAALAAAVRDDELEHEAP
jgi:hypothetical protein